MKYYQKGFTLIELLIVIAVIGIIAAVVFVALDPLTRFQDARDSSRWTDINALLSAIKVDQVDNGGAYASAVSGTTAGAINLIGTCASGAIAISPCDVAPTVDACLDLNSGSDDILTEGYISAIPISPEGTGTWNAITTGYTLQRLSTGILTIRSCESEGGTAEIFVAK